MHARLPFRYTVCGLRDLELHRSAGVTHVVSILDPDAPVPPELREYGPHKRLDLRFSDHINPAATRRAPARREHVEALLAFAEAMVREKRKDAHLLVHCQGGWSRSAASLALIMAKVEPRLSAGWVVGEVLRVRPRAWPSLLLMELGDELLGRDGDFVSALGCVYREQLRKMPEIEERRRKSGRERELELASAMMSLGVRMREVAGRTGPKVSPG
ncbi:tyrosine phosphatase family protein [Roseomonas sp. WA12]